MKASWLLNTLLNKLVLNGVVISTAWVVEGVRVVVTGSVRVVVVNLVVVAEKKIENCRQVCLKMLCPTNMFSMEL